MESKCVLCNKVTEDLHLHHILPKSKGGSDNIHNLVKICTSCHNNIHGTGHMASVSLVKNGIKNSKKLSDEKMMWVNSNDDIVNSTLLMIREKNGDKYDLIILMMNTGVVGAVELYDLANYGYMNIKKKLYL